MVWAGPPTAKVLVLPTHCPLLRRPRPAPALPPPGQAYGAEGAAEVTPLTFQLPSQLLQWRAWMQAHPCGPGRPQRLWILKTAQHLGEGLGVEGCRAF